MAENAVGNDAIMRLCKVVCEDDSSYRSNQDDEPPVDDAHEALAKEVYLLRKERDDLQGALKARDMELTALRERYELLLTAVEQQDEAIAAIYATTGAPNATQALEQYSAIRESCLLLTAQKKMGRTAHEMLQAHLDSMGFEGLDVAPVVAALQEQNPGSSGRHDLALLNSALDQLLYAPSNNNFDGSATTPEASSLSHLAATGFLRRKSGRLSVSDFGLLETSSPRRDSDPLFTDDEEDHTAPTAEAQGEPVEELTYNGFLERLSLPGSRDLVDHIRRFLGSILGPRGDGQPPTSSHFVDYPFCGNTNFQARCEGFFRGMDELLAKHPAWRHAPESTLVAARDGIEKYVMDKLADIPLTQLPRSREWRQEDAVLWRRMQLLSVHLTSCYQRIHYIAYVVCDARYARHQAVHAQRGRVVHCDGRAPAHERRPVARRQDPLHRTLLQHHLQRPQPLARRRRAQPPWGRRLFARLYLHCAPLADPGSLLERRVHCSVPPPGRSHVQGGLLLCEPSERDRVHLGARCVHAHDRSGRI
ncbi:hypothetical protein, variant [Saprolegnia diclina VS20]|uniref:RABX5 catalytic core helical domain-containing protein n=1 Tax=Saprolegnia diclina (strain VS20) TaxID=1156394 RepID=T0Q669_SAPDV|nr:hypothetical protein, variant [Saprolegnia diclina VS20]EQC28940.1 hypothetical protein, variant [Saprolegnia diclina VS20]|eukprot:XP_008617579.1 hypothetical protein, variant [Saprolegnia diclina VS20]